METFFEIEQISGYKGFSNKKDQGVFVEILWSSIKRSSLGGNDTLVNSSGDCLGSIESAEFIGNVLKLPLHGAQGHFEMLADLLVAEALPDQPENFSLSVSKRWWAGYSCAIFFAHSRTS